MLYVQKNSLNTLIFTGSELSTLTANTQFLFICKNRETKNQVSFVGINSSTATSRYDRVYFTETGTTAVYSGVTIPYFSLSPGGFWDVKIYSQYSTSNLFASAATQLVEYDVLLVSGYTQTNNYFFSGGSITNHIFLRT